MYPNSLFVWFVYRRVKDMVLICAILVGYGCASWIDFNSLLASCFLMVTVFVAIDLNRLKYLKENDLEIGKDDFID